MPRLIGIFLYIGFLFAAFSNQWVRDFSVLNLNPFVSVQFFAAAALMVAVFHMARGLLANFISFPNVLAVLNLIFFIFMFSMPLHVLLFGVYYYLVYTYAQRTEWKYAGALALALSLVPLIVARSAKEVQFLGLSYISFRAFHMVIDRLRIGEVRLRDHFLYLTFFPAIMAGPIDRYPRFKSDLEKGYSQLNTGYFAEGIQLVLFGLVQKFIFAEWIFKKFLGPVPRDLFHRLIDMYAYSAFLYLEFAGYSAMAMGLGYMLGIRLPENFNKPYLAVNPQDFWRRFHITLGDWLKDYFFLPLYRQTHAIPALANWPLLKQNIALFLTFLLMGYWNGRHTHYLICGALFGLYSVTFNSYVWWRKRNMIPDLFAPLGPLGRPAAIFLTLNAASLALYFFSGRIL